MPDTSTHPDAVAGQAAEPASEADPSEPAGQLGLLLAVPAPAASTEHASDAPQACQNQVPDGTAPPITDNAEQPEPIPAASLPQATAAETAADPPSDVSLPDDEAGQSTETAPTGQLAGLAADPATAAAADAPAQSALLAGAPSGCETAVPLLPPTGPDAPSEPPSSAPADLAADTPATQTAASVTPGRHTFLPAGDALQPRSSASPPPKPAHGPPSGSTPASSTKPPLGSRAPSPQPAQGPPSGNTPRSTSRAPVRGPRSLSGPAATSTPPGSTGQAPRSASKSAPTAGQEGPSGEANPLSEAQAVIRRQALKNLFVRHQVCASHRQLSHVCAHAGCGPQHGLCRGTQPAGIVIKAQGGLRASLGRLNLHHSLHHSLEHICLLAGCRLRLLAMQVSSGKLGSPGNAPFSPASGVVAGMRLPSGLPLRCTVMSGWSGSDAASVHPVRCPRCTFASGDAGRDS